jgi:hypothetical protein
MPCRAARHGLKLNGKLKRIQEQEQHADTCSTCTASQDKREALARTSSDLVDPQCLEKQSRKRKRTRDESIKKKKRLGA